jgi:hypothetical protein
MEHKIIKTDNYLLVVSDESIEDLRPLKDRWHLESGSILNKFPDYLTDLSECKLVLAHLPLNNSSYLDGVDVLPPLEDEVEELAEKEYCEQTKSLEDSLVDPIFDTSRFLVVGFVDGYNKAKEKYKYTEEDIAKAVMFGRWGATDKIAYNNFIQSLNQPTLPIAFERKIDNILSYNADDGIDALVNPNFGEPKTITNSQGLTEWVGEYKF